MTARLLAQRIFAERRRVMLPLAVVLVANVAVLGLAVVPMRHAATAAALEADAAAADLVAAHRLEQETAGARASKEHADEDLRRFYSDVLPDDLPDAQKIMNLFVTEAARGAGLEFQGSRFDWGDVRDSALMRASSRITLRGAYRNIRQFLHDVESAEEFIVVERVELVQQTDEAAAGGGLEVSLVVATYFAAGPTP
jgi:Tfp pilus assembly protein PilO